VGGHQFKQVVGLGRLRKLAQLDHPVGILFQLFPHQGAQKMTFADALNGIAELVDFGPNFSSALPYINAALLCTFSLP
jgi:hypothetical protein